MPRCAVLWPAGVGDSLVEFAKAKGVDMVAVGSRGMGSVKRSLMSLVGLGSVSDYVLHQLHVPVLVVHAGQGAAAAAGGAPQDGQVCGWLRLQRPQQQHSLQLPQQLEVTHLADVRVVAYRAGICVWVSVRCGSKRVLAHSPAVCFGAAAPAQGVHING